MSVRSKLEAIGSIFLVFLAPCVPNLAQSEGLEPNADNNQIQLSSPDPRAQQSSPDPRAQESSPDPRAQQSIAKNLCETFNLSPRLLQIQRLLKKERESAPLIGQFKLSDQPILLFDTEEQPQCALLINKDGSTTKILLNKKIHFSYDHYSIYYHPDLYPGHIYSDDPLQIVSESLRRELLNLKIAKAYVHWFGSGPYKSTVPRIGANFGLMAHEAFHDFGFEIGPSTIAFDEMHGPYCYTKNNETIRLHRLEVQSLIGAYRALKRSNFKVFLVNARNYIAFREKRYVMAGKINYYDEWTEKTRTANCKEIEGALQNSEGLPQFLEYQYSIDIAGVDPEAILKQIEATTNWYLENHASHPRPMHSYYHTGALQLMILKILHNGNFAQVAQRIINDKDNLELFRVFEDSVANLDKVVHLPNR